MSTFDGKKKYAEYKLVYLIFKVHTNRNILKLYLIIPKTLNNYATKIIKACKTCATPSLCNYLKFFREFRVGDASQNYKLLFKNGSYTGDAG